MVKKILSCGLLSLSAALVGCQTTTGSVPLKTGGSSVGDTADRTRLNNEIILGDFIAMAENVTNRMLVSREVSGWGEARPLVVVGEVRNDTSNDGISPLDIQNRVQEVIIESGVARIVMDKNATNFDYITTSVLTSQPTQYDGQGRSMTTYVFTMRLLDKQGVVLGQWTEDLRLNTGAEF